MNAEDRDTSSATWKFDFEDTVNADPLAVGACLKVLRVYLNFASKSKPEAFCSTTELMLRTGSSKPRILRAKATLERLGYLVPMYVTDEGSTMYRLVNCRKDTIDDHLLIGREALVAERRDRKRRERKNSQRGNETIPPQTDYWERNVTPVRNETLPNTVDVHRGGSSNEGATELLEAGPYNDNLYAMASGDDPTVPFDVPRDDDEADEILSQIGTVHPAILTTLRRMLMNGELTPALLLSDFGGGNAGA